MIVMGKPREPTITQFRDEEGRECVRINLEEGRTHAAGEKGYPYYNDQGLEIDEPATPSFYREGDIPLREFLRSPEATRVRYPYEMHRDEVLGYLQELADGKVPVGDVQGRAHEICRKLGLIVDIYNILGDNPAIIPIRIREPKIKWE